MTFSEYFNTANIESGFTYNLQYGYTPSSGYSISIFKNAEASYNHIPTIGQLADYVLNNYHLLYNTQEGQRLYPQKMFHDVCLGGWMDDETGVYYLDCSIVVPTLEKALQLARENEQLAIFDLSKFQTIYV